MKKLLTKIKFSLTLFRIVLISFTLKVKGSNLDEGISTNGALYGVPSYIKEGYALYGVPSSIEEPPYPIKEISQTPTLIDTIIKIAPRLLIAITFVIGIISFIKIRKIDDKILKKRKIKKTTIIISMLVILIIILLLLPRFLKKYL